MGRPPDPRRSRDPRRSWDEAHCGPLNESHTNWREALGPGPQRMMRWQSWVDDVDVVAASHSQHE